MNFFRFRIHVIIRLIAILILSWASYYVVTQTSFWLLLFWFVLFAVLIFISLLRFVEKSNRDLSNFLMAIKQNDFSNIYPEKHSRSKALHHAFNTITREFIKLRSEKESNFHFLKTVVEHSGVPLLAYDVVRELAASDQPLPIIDGAAMELLSAYDWPRNATELTEVMRACVSDVTGEQIEVSDLPATLVQAAKAQINAQSGDEVSEDFRADHLKTFLRSAVS